jgi:hypothetical protein
MGGHAITRPASVPAEPGMAYYSASITKLTFALTPCESVTYLKGRSPGTRIPPNPERFQRSVYDA